MSEEMSLTQMPNQQNAVLRQSLESMRGGDLDTARESLIDLLEGNPELAAGHVALGQVFAAEDDHARAVEHFEEATALQPWLMSSYFLGATSYESLGDVDSAVSMLNRAITASPTRSSIYRRKSQILKQAGRQEEALKAIEDGVRRNPQDAALRTTLASMLYEAGDTEGALEKYKRSVELDPDNWRLLFSYGTALLREGKLEEAHAAMSRSADLEPERSKTHQALGYILARMGDHASAVLAYEAAYYLEPRDTQSLVGAVYSLNEIGKHDEALEIIEGTGQQGARNPAIQRALGDTYLGLERYDSAIETYTALILNNPRIHSSNTALLELAESDPGKKKSAHARALQDALNENRMQRHDEATEDEDGEE